MKTTVQAMRFAATGKADLKTKLVPVDGWHCLECGKLWGKAKMKMADHGPGHRMQATV